MLNRASTIAGPCFLTLISALATKITEFRIKTRNILTKYTFIRLQEHINCLTSG